MGSQRYTQLLGATTVLQTTVAAVSIFANQPLTNRAGRPFSSIVAETLAMNDASSRTGNHNSLSSTAIIIATL